MSLRGCFRFRYIALACCCCAALVMAIHFIASQTQVKPSLAPQLPVEKTTTISLVGDIMLGSRVSTLARKHGMAFLFDGVAERFQHDDLTLGNLECAVTNGGIAQEKQYTFRMDPKWLPEVKACGVDIVSVANNHSLDYGRTAFSQGLTEITNAGIAYAGGGDDSTSAVRASYFKTDNGVIAVLAASHVLPRVDWAAGSQRPGLFSAYDPQPLLTAIREAKQQASVLIIYLHWGIERASLPRNYQRILAKSCIDAGADVVVGTHPHVLQGFEFYQGKLIAYSLGNFIFSDQYKLTMILQLHLSSEHKVTAQVLPFVITRCRPFYLSSIKQQQQLFSTLTRQSYGATITADGMITGE